MERSEERAVIINSQENIQIESDPADGIVLVTVAGLDLILRPDVAEWIAAELREKAHLASLTRPKRTE
jgi:hypothetical protein